MLDNPLNAYMQMAEAKNRNRQQMYQDIAGIGQGIGGTAQSIAQAMKEQKKKQILAKLVQAVQQQGAPQQGPQLPGVGMTPGMPAPKSGIGAPGQDNNSLIQSLMLQYDPQSAMRMMPTPLQQSEIAKNNAMAKRYNQMTSPPGSGGPLTPQQELRQKYIDAINRRTEIQGKSVDNRQRNLLLRGTNLPGQQLKALTQNNMRADRALDLLSKPNVTWQSLGFAITDLGAIMQGGVPHKEQILEAQFPSWKQKVAQYKTFATGQPTANVPEPIRNEVVRMIQSLKSVDNEFLQQNMRNQMDILGPTVQGFGAIKPIIEKGTKDFMGGMDKPTVEDGWIYTPGPGGKANQANWKKQ